MTMNDRERTSGSGCALHADALAALVDGMLDARGQRRVDEHLADCAACRDLLADLREIRALAASLEPIEPPARVRHDVRRRIAAEERTPRVAVGWWRHWSLGRAALAAAAGIVLAVVLTGSPDRGAVTGSGCAARHGVSAGGRRPGTGRTSLRCGHSGSGAALQRQGPGPPGDP